MKIIKEKFYIGTQPKSLNRNKIYSIVHAINRVTLNYKYNFNLKGWELYPKRIRAGCEKLELGNNYYIAKNINIIVSHNRREGYSKHFVYEIDKCEINKLGMLIELKK